MIKKSVLLKILFLFSFVLFIILTCRPYPDDNLSGNGGSNNPPEAPTGVTVTAAENQLTVSWSAVTGAVSYNIYYSASSTIPGSPNITGITVPTTTITGLTNGTLYYIWVTASNSIGESSPSSVKTGTPVAAITIPEAPIGVVPLPGGRGELNVSWLAVTGATSYSIYYNTSSTIPGSPNITGITVPTTTITGLADGTLYYIWVTASNSIGESSPSTSATCITLPASPTGVVVTAGGAGELNVSWNAVTGALGYKAYYNTVNNYASATGTDAGISLSKTITTLTNGTVYYIWITASNAAGESAPSAVQSLSTIMPAPTGVTVIAEMTEGFRLRWSAVTGAASYDIYYSASPTPPGSPNVTGITGTNTTITSLSAWQNYNIWIKAVGTSGAESSHSAMASGKTIIVGDKSSHTIGGINFDMICVPGGQFKLGAANPEMTITKGYRLAETEVTQGLWEAVMGAGNNSSNFTTNPEDAGPDGWKKLPVEQVTWYDAIAFCNKLSILDGKTPVYTVSGVNFSTLAYGDIPVADNSEWNEAAVNWNADGYRLPTEMEWMWAAMGGTIGQGTHDGGVFNDGYSKQYAGHNRVTDLSGTNIDNYAWHSGNSQSPGMTEMATHEVGVKDPNELGLYDMSGNVFERCWDWYDSIYPGTGQTDYQGPGTAFGRVIRGGSWSSVASSCTVAYRYSGSGLLPDFRYYYIGFRFMRTAD